MSRTATTRTSTNRTTSSRNHYAGFYLAIGDSMTYGMNQAGGFLDPLSGTWAQQLYSYLQTTYSGTWRLKQSWLSSSTSTLGHYRYSPQHGRFWKFRGLKPTVVTIELGTNHVTGGQAHSGTFADEATAISVYQADMPEMISYLTGTMGVAASNILLLGLPPWHTTGAWTGRYYGGSKEDLWNQWNGLGAYAGNGIVEAVAATAGVVYVPMYDVYDPGVGQYNPNTTQTHTIGATDSHPNATGHTSFYNRVLNYLPNLTSVIGRPSA